MSVLNDKPFFHFLGAEVVESYRFIFVRYFYGPEDAFMFTILNYSKMCILMPSKLTHDYCNDPIISLPCLYVVYFWVRNYVR
jgi:hypothetical protein